MKRTLIVASVAALAFVGMAGTANAAPNDASCFGQIHKSINTESLLDLPNVGVGVKALGGQGKNNLARTACGA